MISSGTAYQICGIPEEVILNSKGNSYYDLYVHDQESYAARWLKSNIELENTKIFTDWRGIRLISQGMIPFNKIDRYTRLKPHEYIDGYIYLRYRNVVYGKVLDGYSESEFEEYEGIFAGEDKIYTNGGSEVYRGY